ncbi:tRNA 5-methylaminomethyl-2-thiouridine biosynthesis bifunctional protein MnmC [Dyadobacter sp. CECT 9623]|uniref:tRNA 5-methylaminomethyl-2-thiouridine biosynthesis bifunctional protein MnmC n=1 Tax=Dyadobacter linearis TaxID=2823330 RepID=A0ABM8UUP8_9BACT|nr:FAD-binding oxidoreductase [Dyadobacter sp. CECT 9623]CAG5072150.1 tRNA 5-methylaminomethyl-2-thiouridine biosynthesis bifunctional protein MnmC [Dyadobacter sp. CECT 9623]
MTPKDYDYLIVGQGLAGTSLALHLLEMGKKVLVIGDSSMPSSTKVAAGIFNPLTGKKLVKTWLADDLFPYAQKFYGDLESRLNCKLIYSTPIFRPFRSIEEQNTYLAQTADPSISPYIAADNRTDLSHYVESRFGGLEVIQAGWVDLPLFLEKSRELLSELDSYMESTFALADLRVEPESVFWKDLSFGTVVFCQGFFGVNNPFFEWLPFAPVKGQILEVATDQVLPGYIVNQGIFMLPVKEHSMRVGATYSWDPLDWEPTDSGTAEINEKLEALIRIPYRITSASAGVRPSVKDRRPLIGIHPDHANVAIFNGLGTKGVTLGPFFARQLAEHLENGKELNPLVNIQRYFSLYFR